MGTLFLSPQPSTGDLLVAAVAAVAIPGLLFVVSIPFGAGAIGQGDLKLLFGVGLIVGALRLGATVILGAVAAAVAIVILLALRRIWHRWRLRSAKYFAFD